MKRCIPTIRAASALLLFIGVCICAGLPGGYKGKPFEDEQHHSGAQVIPGTIQCALYDLGGEGVAYHDTDVINKGSGELNRRPDHCRPGTPDYICYFREKESVDISYTKDFADFNHPNLVAPEKNQLYIGATRLGWLKSAKSLV